MVEKFKQHFKRVFSNGPKAKIVLCSIVTSVLILTIYNMRTTVIVRIDNEEQRIVTYKGTVKGALQSNDITLGEKDKVSPQLEDRINDDDIISIKRAVPIEVYVDGETLEIQTAESNIEDMLEAENITLNEDDKLSIPADTLITEDLKLKVTRVETKDIVETQALDYQTVVKNDDSMDKGMSKVVQEGTQGEKEVTVKVIYEDGVEVERKVVGEKITKEPTSKVVHQGTLSYVALSRGGDSKLYYKQALSVKASAYAGDGITATGTVPKRNPSGLSTIAVDPRVIPLGTKVYVEGYGYAVAEDTGGAIKNNKIDIFMNSTRECYQWGVRTVNLYVVAYPGQW